MSSAKGIVHIHIAELLQALAESLNLCGIGLGFAAVCVDSLALFLHVETQILQQNNGTGRWVFARSLHLGTNAVVQEENVLLEKRFQFISNGRQSILEVLVAVGSTKMGAQHHRFRPLSESILDAIQSRNDTLVAGDLSVLDGHVEVNAADFM